MLVAPGGPRPIADHVVRQRHRLHIRPRPLRVAKGVSLGPATQSALNDRRSVIPRELGPCVERLLDREATRTGHVRWSGVRSGLRVILV